LELIIEKIISARGRSTSIGFGAKVLALEDRKAGEIFREVEPEDLLKYGLIPEFVGRLRTVLLEQEKPPCQVGSCRAARARSAHKAAHVVASHQLRPPRSTCESFLIEMAERTQIQLKAGTHMFFSQAVPVQRSRSARLRLENARRSYRSSFCNLGRT
jgi:hypothetical protein